MSKYQQYNKDVQGLKKIDVYRVIKLWNVTDPAIQHAIKKLLNAGERGVKSFEQDVQEAIDSLTRCLQMIQEDRPFPDGLRPGVVPAPAGVPMPVMVDEWHVVPPTPAAPPAPSDPAPMPAPAPAQINAATGTPASLHAAYHHGRADALQGLAPSNPFPAGSAEMPKYVEGYKAGAKKMVDSDTAQTSVAQAPLDPYERGRASARVYGPSGYPNPYKLWSVKATQWQKGYDDESAKLYPTVATVSDEEAYEAGKKAAQACDDVSSCPYIDDNLSAFWRAGWTEEIQSHSAKY